jgi:hypothetical protein
VTKQEFIYQAESTIFKEVAKATNQLCGQSKTSSMIANLFVNLPIKVEARFIANLPKPAKKLNALDEFVTAYLKHDDTSKVMIAFFYSSEAHLTKIFKRIEKHPTYFAYLYMREALKVSRLMNTKTHYTMMSNIIKYNAPSINPEEHYHLSLAACDYTVNDIINQLFKASAISNKLDEIFEHVNYNASWSGKSEMDILVQLVGSRLDKSEEQLGEFTYDATYHLIYSMHETDNSISMSEAIQTDLGESISNALATMSRGTGSAAIFESAFAAKKVKTGWFKKLTNKFTKDVHYITSTFRSEWSSLNITYRHKFKAPKHTHEDHKLSVILSIDHSGSVSTDGLQKLLYLFSKHSKRISDLYIIIHDDDIVKEFHIQSDFDVSADPEFTQALSNRIACGGTSHFKVFTRIAELLKSKTIDPSKSLYISFSDNYSDIPESWKATPAMTKLYSTTFLAPEHNPVSISGTTDISMS